MLDGERTPPQLLPKESAKRRNSASDLGGPRTGDIPTCDAAERGRLGNGVTAH